MENSAGPVVCLLSYITFQPSRRACRMQGSSGDCAVTATCNWQQPTGGCGKSCCSISPLSTIPPSGTHSSPGALLCKMVYKCVHIMSFLSAGHLPITPLVPLYTNLCCENFLPSLMSASTSIQLRVHHLHSSVWEHPAFISFGSLKHSFPRKPAVNQK